MAAVDENFRTKLVALLPADTPIEEGKISQFDGPTRVWFRRASEKTELHLDGSPGLTTTEFDLEVHSIDIDESQKLAALIRVPATRGGLDGFQGTMGDMDVAGVFVADQDDNYQPQVSLNTDEGYFVPALKITVIFDGG